LKDNNGTLKREIRDEVVLVIEKGLDDKLEGMKEK